MRHHSEVARQLRFVTIVVVLCAAACGSSSPRVSDPGNTTTALNAADQSATYLGLSVRLQVDPPEVEGGFARMRAYFLIENSTKRVISYSGCPFGDLEYGLVPVDHPDAPLTGRSQTSCSGGPSTVQAGASDRFFAVDFNARETSGDYLATVRFSDGTEVRKATTITPSRLQVAPTSGSPPTVISVRGDRCGKSSGPGALDVIVNLTAPDRRTGLTAAHAPVSPDGTWAATMTIPVTAAPGDYQVNATCNRDGDIVELEYESVPFRVDI
jgi:hypothetical protein